MSNASELSALVDKFESLRESHGFHKAATLVHSVVLSSTTFGVTQFQPIGQIAKFAFSVVAAEVATFSIFGNKFVSEVHAMVLSLAIALVGVCGVCRAQGVF